jgi:quercetin dioxygenase-like cupin family protein
MEVIQTAKVPEVHIEDRVLQWIVSENGQAASECCSSCMVQFQPGASAKPPHSHPDCEEAIYILSGTGQMLLKGGEKRQVETGSFLLMRRNEVHMLTNTGPDVMKAICFYSSPTDNRKYDYYDMDVLK